VSYSCCMSEARSGSSIAQYSAANGTSFARLAPIPACQHATVVSCPDQPMAGQLLQPADNDVLRPLALTYVTYSGNGHIALLGHKDSRCI
jgi:hypothetical protein